MDELKYELSVAGLFLSWVCSFILLVALGFNWVCSFRYAPLSVEIVGFIVLFIIFSASYPLQKLRNKYRDAVEYDKNGISRVYGDFSNLSNQERREIERQKLIKREMLIDSATMRTITKKGSIHPEQDLDELIGLANLKEEMHRMAATLLFQKECKQKRKRKQTASIDGQSTYHMCFTGAPGTGKSTCARIMSGFLYKYGIIKKNQYIEVDGNFFNGTTYGESTERVKYIIGQARGGVLFIDEAYALLHSVESQEVIATIVKAMEDYRDELVFIFAGYDREMNALINSNTGLQSRIKYYFHFDNYNLGELWQIFIAMAHNKGFGVSSDAKDQFASHIITEMRKPNYGNARTVRMILDRAIEMHATNYVDQIIPSTDKMTIVSSDLPTNGMISCKVVSSEDIT